MSAARTQQYITSSGACVDVERELGQYQFWDVHHFIHFVGCHLKQWPFSTRQGTPRAMTYVERIVNQVLCHGRIHVQAGHCVFHVIVDVSL